MTSSVVIKEELTPGLKAGLFQNFTNANEALLEIIDNSVAQRVDGETMTIKILFIPGSKKIEIVDSGGRGMDIEQLKTFWQWGLQKSRTAKDIGLYSQGGKAAIGYLGKAFSVLTSPANSNRTYIFGDSNYHDTTNLKTYAVQVGHTPRQEGFTRIVIEKVKKNIFTSSAEEKIKNKLSETYRPLIKEGLVQIFFNTRPIEPAIFPLDTSFQPEEFNFTISDHKLNAEVSGWVGRLLPRKESKGLICNGGMRVYYRGRLILNTEYFGPRDAKYKGSLNYLIGEVNLDEAIRPNMNKTDFDRGADSWVDLEKKMAQILDPHINELLERGAEDISDEEIENAQKTRRLFEETLRLANRDMKLDITTDGGIGIKARQPKQAEINEEEPALIKSRKKPKPRTPPPTDATGRRNRLSKLPEWKLDYISENIRSYLKAEKIKGLETQVLIINTGYSGYKRFLKTPQRGLYLLETAAMQMAVLDSETKSTKEFLEKFDSLFAIVCDYIDQAKTNLQKKQQWKKGE